MSFDLEQDVPTTTNSGVGLGRLAGRAVSAREWKPGDLAVESSGLRAMRTTTGWAYKDGSIGGLHQDHYSARPLVVIDPEDAEQVGRLQVHLLGRRTYSIAQMQDALREFAAPTPPKPEEPLGLGAVVEDYDGHHWVKVDTGMACDSWTQADAGMAGSTWVKFAKLHAVRVLSEGVAP